MNSPRKNEHKSPAGGKISRENRDDRPDPSSTTEKLDEALEESFPASDPIAVTPRRQDNDT